MIKILKQIYKSFLIIADIYIYILAYGAIFIIIDYWVDANLVFNWQFNITNSLIFFFLPIAALYYIKTQSIKLKNWIKER